VITTDNRGDTADLVRRMLRAGVRSPVCVTGDYYASDVAERERGFRDALQGAFPDVESRIIRVTSESADTGAPGTEGAPLWTREGVDGVFAVNASVLLSVVRRIQSDSRLAPTVALANYDQIGDRRARSDTHVGRRAGLRDGVRRRRADRGQGPPQARRHDRADTVPLRVQDGERALAGSWPFGARLAELGGMTIDERLTHLADPCVTSRSCPAAPWTDPVDRQTAGPATVLAPGVAPCAPRRLQASRPLNWASFEAQSVFHSARLVEGTCSVTRLSQGSAFAKSSMLPPPITFMRSLRFEP